MRNRLAANQYDCSFSDLTIKNHFDGVLQAGCVFDFHRGELRHILGEHETEAVSVATKQYSCERFQSHTSKRNLADVLSSNKSFLE